MDKKTHTHRTETNKKPKSNIILGFGARLRDICQEKKNTKYFIFETKINTTNSFKNDC